MRRLQGLKRDLTTAARRCNCVRGRWVGLDGVRAPVQVEFENGRDITRHWSWELPVEFGYWCPLPI